MTSPNGSLQRQTSRAPEQPEVRPRGSGADAWKSPRVAFISGVVLMAVVALAIAAGTGALPWQDYTRRQPPNYLILSFADPSSLPSSATVGRPVPFEVDVTNPAPKQRTVRWTVNVRDEGTGASRQLLAQTTLVPGRGQIRTAAEVVPDATGRQQVTVTTDTGETIAFHLTVVRAGAPSTAGA